MGNCRCRRVVALRSRYIRSNSPSQYSIIIWSSRSTAYLNSRTKLEKSPFFFSSDSILCVQLAAGEKAVVRVACPPRAQPNLVLPTSVQRTIARLHSPLSESIVPSSPFSPDPPGQANTNSRANVAYCSIFGCSKLHTLSRCAPWQRFDCLASSHASVIADTATCTSRFDGILCLMTAAR
jgi:hypothetical protein